MQDHFNFIVIGGGVSGSIIAEELVSNGHSVLMLEAGKFFYSNNYPRFDIDSNSQMYWNGGVELTSDAEIGLVRPKMIGGGSIINGGLLDRFDDLAFEGFKDESGIKFFNNNEITPWFEKIENKTSIVKVPEEFANKNADIFREGFKANGFTCNPLDRGQTDCRYNEGMDCIECLAGCPINSKQSTMITYVRSALKKGLKVFSEFEVKKIERGKIVKVHGTDRLDKKWSFSADKLVLASGSIGNSKLLINSNFKNPNIGKRFYTHPQYMLMAEFNYDIDAYKGPLQSYKSDDVNFRNKGFKLENVFAPPAAISVLFKGIQQEHFYFMKNLRRFASIEVAIRDTNPGEIKVGKNNKTIVHKELDAVDLKRKSMGYDAIKNIFYSQGAKRVIEGEFGIGLHLMGGCAIGVDGSKSVIDPEFRLHDEKNIFCADSSIFPNAPGINPSLTIMALSKMAAQKYIK